MDLTRWLRLLGRCTHRLLKRLYRLSLPFRRYLRWDRNESSFQAIRKRISDTWGQLSFHFQGRQITTLRGTNSVSSGLSPGQGVRACFLLQPLTEQHCHFQATQIISYLWSGLSCLNSIGMTESREQIKCQLFLKLPAVTFTMNIFFLGLEHSKLAGFPFQFMAQNSKVIPEGTLNFLNHSNNVSVLQRYTQNPRLKPYPLKLHLASTVCNNETLVNTFRSDHKGIIFLFLYCSHLFSQAFPTQWPSTSFERGAWSNNIVRLTFVCFGPLFLPEHK